MQERDVFVDHSTIRLGYQAGSGAEEAFRKRKRTRGIGAVDKS
jgi:hypothetical protein